MGRVYLEVYRGIRGKWQFGIHTSVYVEGDACEWAYGGKSRLSARNEEFSGVICERNRQFLYGDWIFWKSVYVGEAGSLCKYGAAGDALARSRRRIKKMVGPSYSDDGYHWLLNNCWKFCYDLLAAMGVRVPRTMIEELNDERLQVFRGTTAFAFKYVLRPLSHLIGWLVRVFVRLKLA